jgi:hypothetical protein
MSLPILRRPLNRIEPKIPAGLMHTHLILQPLRTHFREATCEEVNCPQFLEGWFLQIDALPQEDIDLAKNAGRRWRQVHVAANENYLYFEPGQKCFKASTHRVNLDHDPIFVKKEGDHRGNPRRLDPIRFSGADSWANSLGENLDQIAWRR